MEQANLIRNVLRQSRVGDADDGQAEYEEHYNDRGLTDPNLITWAYAWENYPYLRTRMLELKEEMLEAMDDDDKDEIMAEELAMSAI